MGGLAKVVTGAYQHMAHTHVWGWLRIKGSACHARKKCQLAYSLAYWLICVRWFIFAFYAFDFLLREKSNVIYFGAH